MTEHDDPPNNTIQNLGDLWRSQHLFVVLFLGIASIAMLAAFIVYGQTQGRSIKSLPSDNVIRSEQERVDRVVQQRHKQSPGPYRVGIISGHRGSDSGAVCADGLQEVDVNQRIADQVVGRLNALGIEGEILDEYDIRLDQYRANALVSLHADSCGTALTGYKAASAANDHSRALQRCIEQKYQEGTGLPYHASTITPGMTNNHAFRKVHSDTAIIILEMGFLSMDRALLQEANLPADAITRGILCYLETGV